MRTEMEAGKQAQELGAGQDEPVFVPWKEGGRVGIRFTWRGLTMSSAVHSFKDGDNLWYAWMELLHGVERVIELCEEEGFATDFDGNKIFPEGEIAKGASS